MKTTIPTWIGLTLFMLLLVAGGAFYFLYQELLAKEGDVATVEQTVDAQMAYRDELDGTIVALGDQLTRQAGDVADYDATRTAIAPLESNDESASNDEPADPDLNNDNLAGSDPIPAESLTSTVGISPTPTVFVVTDVVPLTDEPDEPTSEPTLESDEGEATATAILPNTPPTPTQSDETSTPRPTRPTIESQIEPSIVMKSPADGDQLIVNETVSVKAAVADPDGLANVWLLVNGDLLQGQSAQNFIEFEYDRRWTPIEVGEYALAIVSIDNRGDEMTTDVINVTVVEAENRAEGNDGE